jgi:hypothetical protein
MKEGVTDTIEYTWSDGTPRLARLEDVNVVPIIDRASDPDWYVWERDTNTVSSPGYGI